MLIAWCAAQGAGVRVEARPGGLILDTEGEGVAHVDIRGRGGEAVGRVLIDAGGRGAGDGGWIVDIRNRDGKALIHIHGAVACPHHHGMLAHIIVGGCAGEEPGSRGEAQPGRLGWRAQREHVTHVHIAGREGIGVGAILIDSGCRC